MRSPNPASGLRGSALAINALTHAPVTPILPLIVLTPRPGPSFRKIARLCAARCGQFESPGGSLCRTAGGRAAHDPASCRPFGIRREKSAETLEVSVAVAPQSVWPEVSA